METKEQQLEKFQKVNNCETIQSLMDCIRDFSSENGLIQGRTRLFDAEKMAGYALKYFEDDSGLIPPNVLTREFGIRQQAMYLKFHK